MNWLIREAHLLWIEMATATTTKHETQQEHVVQSNRGVAPGCKRERAEDTLHYIRKFEHMNTPNDELPFKKKKY